MRKTMIHLAKPLCLLLIVSYTLLDLSAQSVRAGLIGTESILNGGQSGEDARARVAAFFARQDVQTAMIGQGVDPEEARSRIAALSDSEVTRISQVIDQLPAGGDVGAIIGAALFIFVVLLVTDILGFTRVFSFVRHPK